MGKFEKGQYVRVLHTDYPENIKVGDVFKVGAAYGHGAEPEGENNLLFFLNHELEPWVPKVGERVRVVKAALSHKADCVGREFTVTKEAYKVDDGVQTWNGDNAGGYVWRADELEPLPVAAIVAAPATLTIEAGKFYKTRDGRKVGPLREEGRNEFFPYRLDGGPHGIVYVRKDGTANLGLNESTSKFWDLIAEWVDEPKASNDNGGITGLIGKSATVQIAQPKFKVGDIVKRANNFQPHQRLRITKVDGDRYSVEWIVGGAGQCR